MRSYPMLAGAALTTAALASCATQPEPPMRTAEAEGQYQRLIAGKAAGAPIACLPSHRTGDMVTIDDGTVAFKQGRTVYVNRLLGECSGLKSGFYSLVTKSSGPGLCRGEIARVMDLSTGSLRGTCAIGDFTPYYASR